MPFNDNKRLDPSQVQDRRGRKTGQTIAIGGGMGLILLLASMFFGVDLTELVNPDTLAPANSDMYFDDIDDLATTCQTGADANERQDCRVVGFVNSIQAFWEEEFPD